MTPPTTTLVRAWRYRDLSGPSSAKFSPCEKYRYELTRSWDPEKPRLVFVGLNPSTADAFEDDPTIRRIIGFAHRWGCGSLLMLNAFAFRSTDPRGLLDTDDPVGPENDATLREAFRSKDRLVLGWGAHAVFEMRGAVVAGWAIADHGNPECLGLTKDGHPRHPLYLPSDARPIPFLTAMTGGLDQP